MEKMKVECGKAPRLSEIGFEEGSSSANYGFGITISSNVSAKGSGGGGCCCCCCCCCCGGSADMKK